jgi:hypothetical protein
MHTLEQSSCWDLLDVGSAPDDEQICIVDGGLGRSRSRGRFADVAKSAITHTPRKRSTGILIGRDPDPSVRRLGQRLWSAVKPHGTRGEDDHPIAESDDILRLVR